MTKTEAYKVFGLSMNQPVTLDQIKNRYRILTKTYHPDNPKTGSEEMMAKVNLAFNALRTFNFDPEETNENRFEQKNGTGFDMDFNPDFTPFEYGSRDESFYQNTNYRRKENSESYAAYEKYYDDNATYEEETSDDYYEEEYEAPVKKKKKKRGGIFVFFRFIGLLCKLFIILGIICFFAAVPACVYFFGVTQRGILLAFAALVLAVLAIFVFKFFSELIS